jgi:hypothetical protein
LRLASLLAAVGGATVIGLVVGQSLHRTSGVWGGLVSGVGATIGAAWWSRRPVRGGPLGEETLRVLRRLPTGFVLLEDVALPASKETRSFIVVGPPGVTLVSARRGSRVGVKRGGLVLDGWIRSDLIHRLKRHGEVVRNGVGLHGVVSLIVSLEGSRGACTVEDVRIVPPKRLLKSLAKREKALQDDAVLQLAGTARRRFVHGTDAARRATSSPRNPET